jgi:multidrug efflux pump subunit AcrA (membrane-fusion protein)
VYAFLGVLAAAGGAYWAQQKYQIFSLSAKADDKKKDGKSGKKGEAEAVPGELATANTGDMAVSIASSGNLRALREIVLSTQAEGRVRRVLVEEGDFVDEGRLLVQIEDRPIRIRLDLARERLAQAQFQLEKAKLRQDKTKIQIEHYQREYDRYRVAHQQGLVGKRAYPSCLPQPADIKS